MDTGALIHVLLIVYLVARDIVILVPRIIKQLGGTIPSGDTSD